MSQLKQTCPPRSLDASLSHALEIAVHKISRNLTDLAAHPAAWPSHPQGKYSEGSIPFHHIDNWTTSFFTGMGVLAFKKTKEQQILTLLDSFEEIYRKKVEAGAANTMHDLGFLYMLYSVALYQATGENHHRDTALRAAELLAKRFVTKGNFLQAWGPMDERDSDYSGLAIIDSMMNLPLLYWATEESGDSHYREIAEKHSETTLEHFFRPDSTLYHAYRFDAETGKAIGGDNYCGSAPESQWARGTCWATLGFALGYRHTKNRRYLDASLNLAEKFALSLDQEIVPIWDRQLKNGDLPIRDSSAAAIAVCAIQELESHDRTSPILKHAKTGLLQRLCSPDYLDTSPCRGLLKHGQISPSRGRAASAYTSWGDYFFMEALVRESGESVTWW